MAPSSETVQLALRARYTKQQGKCLSLTLIVEPMLTRHAGRGEGIDALEWFPTSKEPDDVEAWRAVWKADLIEAGITEGGDHLRFFRWLDIGAGLARASSAMSPAGSQLNSGVV